MEPRHVAISLDGEPTLYPYLPELIEAFHDRDITTFLVSNGTRPEMLRDCDPTQLYVSVDAPERHTFDQVVGAMEEDAWEKLLETMDVLADKDETRTVLRTTLVKGENMRNPDWYAGFYQQADPDFIELKAYMHVGHSRATRSLRDARARGGHRVRRGRTGVHARIRRGHGSAGLPRRAPLADLGHVGPEAPEGQRVLGAGSGHRRLRQVAGTVSRGATRTASRRWAGTDETESV